MQSAEGAREAGGWVENRRADKLGAQPTKRSLRVVAASHTLQMTLELRRAGAKATAY